METKLYVANRVREIRCRLHMRQQDLADQVGVSRQTIISIERGRLFNPTVHTCLMLSRVLREPMDFLFYLVPHRASIHPEANTESLEEASDAPVETDALNSQAGDPPLASLHLAESKRESKGIDEASISPSEKGIPCEPHDPPSPGDNEQRENTDSSSISPAEPNAKKDEPIVQAVWDFSRV